MDTSDLSGGAAPTDPTEAGIDASTDTGGPSTEAGADVATGASFCSTIDGGFCDDFDGRDLSANWDGFEGSSPGSITIDKTASVSAPASLHFDSPSFNSNGGARELFLKKRLGSSGHGTCEFKIRVDHMGADASRVFVVGILADDGRTLYFIFYAGKTGSAAYVERYDSNGQLSLQGTIDIGDKLITFPEGTWRHVKFALDWNNDNPGVLDFTFEGTARPTRNLLQFAGDGVVTAYIGNGEDHTGNALEYRVDDFTCNLD